MARSLRAQVTALGVSAALLLGASASIAAGRYLHAPVGGDRLITILLLGSDQGPYRGGDPLRGRADAWHLLFVNPERGTATFVNVPRDAYVPVPGRGRNRINTCLVGGPERCVATARAVFGVDVDHWIVTDFRGLDEAVDRVGGVVVDVERPLSDGGEDIPRAGRQRLSGAQALAFTRDRKNRAGGDFRRSEAQATLLAAAHAQLVYRSPDVGRIAETVGILQQTAITDIDSPQLLRLAYLALTIAPDEVQSVTLRGRNGMAGPAAVVFLNDSAYGIVRDIAADGVPGTASGRGSG